MTQATHATHATQHTEKNIFELPVEQQDQAAPPITEHEQQDQAALKAIDEARAEEEQAEAYFKSQYDKHFAAAKKAARDGMAACDKLEALAVLSGKGGAEGKSARSYFKMASNKLDKE